LEFEEKGLCGTSGVVKVFNIYYICRVNI